ncbi:protein OCTOPUS [Ricinus communis]|uniref:Uncharacterized protein n=1 Tax=Ricinus communis TaxID=3988 RepID=B9S361_RICCO|nr:protein OCTOPUS [Ricinus communis]EEF41843.1 conserved hypothetical protein [Ricinus communis]|eukprot:XP_002520430.1 UPF0503 protein At3g09070, chloroplastic [Ricinus communis]
MTVPPKPLHHHRHSTCHRHPTRPITGFCASCLRERLAGIDPDTHQETPITHLAAELRRSKSYSCSSNPNNNASSTTSTSTTNTASDQPRRKSCDVRARNTLSDLFNLDDKKRFSLNHKLKVENLGLELKEEEENEVEIRGFEEGSGGNVIGSERNLDNFDKDGEFKTMKEFIDLEWERKRNGGKDFSLWGAASVFRNKLVKWQLKQKKNIKKKEKKHGGEDGDLVVGIGNTSFKRLRDTQSEIGDYGVGRRSCDTDPRLSVDVARLSVDDVRYSFDEPRASWDGYLIGKTYPRLAPLVSVIEDAKLAGNGIENMKDNLDLKNEVETSPGGTAQTREFYSDRRRRRSFDRLGSKRRITLGDDEFKSILNAKVSPEIGLFHGAKLLVTEKELRDSNWYSVKDYHGESTDALAKDIDSVAAGISKKVFKFNKLQRWSSVWKIWGLMQKRSESKCGDEESSIGGNVVDEQVGEPLQKLGGVPNVEANETVSQKLIRSYTVSARDSSKMACSARTIVDNKEYVMKRREDPVLQRNRSARYSPNHLDNGMLRFYLTPLRNYGRSRSGKSRLQNSHSMTRNVL